MLQRYLCSGNLALVGRATKLPYELGALREARRAERMAFGQQAARRVGDDLTAVGVLCVPDKLLGLAFLAQPEALVRQDLVRSKAVVELADLHVLRPEPSLLVDLLRGVYGHVVADHLDHALLEAGRVVRRHRLRGDPHRGRVTMLLREVVRADDRGGGTASRRAALVARQRVEHLFAREDLLDREHLVEDRERIVRRVLAGLLAHLREGLLFRAVLPAVLPARAAEHLGGGRSLSEPLRVQHHFGVLGQGALAVVVLRAESALLHLLESQRERALHRAAFDRLLRQHERRRSGGAVVVHVEDGHAREPHFVRRALPARTVSVHVAGVHLLDGLVWDLRVPEGGARRLRRHHVVLLALAGFCELRHPDANHVDSSSHGSHRLLCVVWFVRRGLSRTRACGQPGRRRRPAACLADRARARRPGPCRAPRGPRRKFAGRRSPCRPCPRAPPLSR